MADAELQEVAEDADSLTDVARQALQAELARRSLPELPAKAERVTAKTDAPAPVLIRRYRDLLDASMAKSIFDSAGIEGSLIDDNIVRIDWFYSNLVGGIKLMVRQEDAEEALKLLDEAAPEKFALDGTSEYTQPRCPKCDSMDVSLDGLDRRASYASLFFSLPIPVTQKGWKCHACDHSWKEESSAEGVSGPKKEA
jgi:transposase-like protein